MSLHAKFIKSAVNKADYPRDRRPEFAMVGRSNAGKSSVINSLTRSKIAKISQTPGKTALLNFFLCGETFYLVDMPGYGFAKRPLKERKMWRTMIEGYINHRKNLGALLLIIDIKRKWTKDEELIWKWCQSRDLPVVVVLNKMDKVGQSEKVLNKREMEAIVGKDKVICVSAKSGVGVKDLGQMLINTAQSFSTSIVQED